MASTPLPMPSKLSKFSNETKISNYFKQLHDVVAQLHAAALAHEKQKESTPCQD